MGEVGEGWVLEEEETRKERIIEYWRGKDSGWRMRRSRRIKNWLPQYLFS
jgi:hypothetical protein